MSRWVSLLAVLSACSGEAGVDAGADAGMDAAVGAPDAGDAGTDAADGALGMDANTEHDAGSPADAGRRDAGPGTFLVPGYACPPDFIIAAIYDDGALPGEYTLRALGPMGPAVTLLRDGVAVYTLAYDWETTLGAVGSGREYTFSFDGYFHVVVAHASAGTRDLSQLDACLFDGTKVLYDATARPDAGPMFDAGPFHDGGQDGGQPQDAGCFLDDIYEDDDTLADATPFPFGRTLGYTACADGARVADADWFAPMTHAVARFLELDGLGGEYVVESYDAAGALLGSERGTPPLQFVIATGVRYLAVSRVAMFACSCADYSLRMETSMFW